MILFGADRLEECKELLRGRVALATSPTGRTLDGRSTIDALRELCDLRLLLAPEHGVRGDLPAGADVAGCLDRSGLPMVSMYSADSKRLAPEVFGLVDTIVYDIQDVGARFYTFISTLKTLVEDCAAHHKRLVVLDRPNPLGGKTEGWLLEKETGSFVGCHEIPIRYGLTCGEFARMVMEEEGLSCDLHIVPCKRLARDMTFRDWGRPWAMPSPNIPRFENALLYPGTCFLEGTNFSEGRGTADPFAILGAPFADAEALTAAFNALALPGVTALPVWFTPWCSKHAGKLCGGVHLQVTDEKALRPVELGVRLLTLLQSMYPADFEISPVGPLWPRPFLDHLMGLADAAKRLKNPEALMEKAETEAADFAERMTKYHIY